MTGKTQASGGTDRVNDLIVERLIDQLTMLDERLTAIETGQTPTSAKTLGGPQTLNEELMAMKLELQRVNARAASMRFDRQIKLIFTRIFRLKSKETKLQEKREAAKITRDEMQAKMAENILTDMTIESDIILFCSSYPGGARDYGGEFIQKRAEAYITAGLKLVVVEVSAATDEVKRHHVNTVDVLRMNISGMKKLLRLSNFKVMIAHSIEKPLWSVIKERADVCPLYVWVHGFEARDWKELSFNFTDKELTTLRPRLDQANHDRRATMNEVFSHPNTHVIFVSNYMRNIAEGFAGVPARHADVIHNSISAEDFPYVEKSPDMRKNILWVRTFAARNYANDISRDVILGLSKKPYFKDLTISIFGAGRFFNDITHSLAHFDNVKITNRFLSREDLRAEHAKHGVKLVPTRWDSQGLTCGEAMHSGLVPLTSHVTGLPEFIDDNCAISAGRDDSQSLIDGFDRMFHDPSLFKTMSKNAAKRSQSQCNPDKTLNVEMALLKFAIANKT